jgi:hypothetical protein
MWLPRMDLIKRFDVVFATLPQLTRAELGLHSLPKAGFNGDAQEWNDGRQEPGGNPPARIVSHPP